jgi:BolA protein
MNENSDIPVGDRIKARLQSALAPVSIEVIDESHKHASHTNALARRGLSVSAGETHYLIRIVSGAFKGKSRIERHRTINHILLAEFASGLHALAIDAKAPDE